MDADLKACLEVALDAAIECGSDKIADMLRRAIKINEGGDVQRIVINGDYGGFGLTDDITSRYRELSGGRDWYAGRDYDRLGRDDPLLVRAVEESIASGFPVGDLKIVEVPAGIEWCIDEYDGFERVDEKGESWG